MKRFLRICAGLCLAAVLGYLAVDDFLNKKRASRLDRALMDAEARVMQLESDLDALKANTTTTAQPAKIPATHASTVAPVAPRVATASVPAETSAAPAQQGSTATPAQPSIGMADGATMALLRYAALGSAGLTNFVRIEGTSSIHDWQVEGRLIGGSAELPADFLPRPSANTLTSAIPARVNVFIPVRSLKSIEKDGRPYSDKMDEIMYEKLKAESFKRITYSLTELNAAQAGSSNAPAFLAKGELCVAGVTNTISMPVTITSGAGGKICFAGSIKVKMTDFGIQPPNPAIAGGAIKTGDEVRLNFGWWVNRVAPLEAAK